MQRGSYQSYVLPERQASDPDLKKESGTTV